MVELRCFGGLTIEETAEAPNISPNTVMRDWRLELLESAMRFEPGRRAAFLDKACAGDDQLHRDVESLLAYEGRGEDAPATAEAMPPRVPLAMRHDHDRITRGRLCETARLGRQESSVY